MKYQGIFSYKFMVKHKYLYFVLCSLFFAVSMSLMLTLFFYFFTMKEIKLASVIYNFFIYWAVGYPFSFIVFERTKKQNIKKTENSEI